jgi:tetratricopeptide (TPR) repeat protein
MRFLPALLLILMAAGSVHAQTAHPEIAAADRVIQLLTAKDDAALKTIAGQEMPDPWWIVDELCGRGDFDAARAFASFVPPARGTGMAEFIERQEQSPIDPAYRAAQRRAKALWLTKKPREALAASASVEKLGVDVTSVRIVILRALLHLQLRDTSAALTATEDAIARCRKLGWAVAEAKTRFRLGVYYREAGDLDRCMEVWNEALRLHESVRLPREVARLQSALGMVHLVLGEYRTARDLQRKALAYQRTANDPRPLATVLLNLGNAYLRLGNLAEALTCYEDSAAQAAPGGYVPGQAACHAGLGEIYLQLGAPDEAEKHVRKALSLQPGDVTALGTLTRLALDQGRLEEAERLGPQVRDAARDPRSRALATVLVGRIAMRRGDRKAARAEFEKALSAAEERDSTDIEFSCLSYLAELCLADGDARGAAGFARRGADLAPEMLRGLADLENATARGSFVSPHLIGLAASVRLNDPARFFWFTESLRAGALLESLEGVDVLATAGTSKELTRDLAAAKEREAKAGTAVEAARKSGAGRKKVRDLLRALDDARLATAGVHDRIERRKRAQAATTPEPAEMSAVVSALGATKVLVIYEVVEEKLFALVVTGSGARIVGFGELEPIRATVESDVFSDRDGDPTETQAKLCRALVAPLNLPETAKAVLLSPDERLYRVPFAALLVDRAIAYVPSATTWIALRRQGALRGSGVLAFGGPDYGTPTAAPAASRLRSGERLFPLPQAAAEAKAVGDVVRTGALATEAEFRKTIATRKRWRAVHFACHGLLDEAHPTLCALALTREGEDDGYLTALEIVNLSIPADLAVLSACRTSRGKVLAAEGLAGLTRAFMIAGSPRVLGSLWKVEDKATRHLMERFYAGLTAKLPPAEALRRAQAAVRALKEWRHPSYWAAWTLWGPAD